MARQPRADYIALALSILASAIAVTCTVARSRAEPLAVSVPLDSTLSPGGSIAESSSGR